VLLGRNFEDKRCMNDSRTPVEMKDRETQRNGQGKQKDGLHEVSSLRKNAIS